MSYEGNDDIYRPPSLSLQTMRTFLAGPGEGLPFQPVSLHFEGVVRVEGDLLRLVTGIVEEYNSEIIKHFIVVFLLKRHTLCSRPAIRQPSNECHGHKRKKILQSHSVLMIRGF